jgi:hypothetical protein
VEVRPYLQGLTSLPSNKRKSRKAGAESPAFLFHVINAVQIGPFHFGTGSEKPVIAVIQSSEAILAWLRDIPPVASIPPLSSQPINIIDVFLFTPPDFPVAHPVLLHVARFNPKEVRHVRDDERKRKRRHRRTERKNDEDLALYNRGIRDAVFHGAGLGG